MNQQQFDKLYLQAMNNGNLPLLEQLIADFPQRATKAPCYEKAYAILASDASYDEKAASCAELVHKNAVSTIRNACICIAVLVAISMFLLPALVGESPEPEFFMVNGAILAVYSGLAALASKAVKFSAYAALILALVVLVSNIVLLHNVAGIIPVILMIGAMRSIPQ